ncbi:MAG: hypothetical protein NVS2B6_16530 [Thermoleophilaceae bacterium]
MHESALARPKDAPPATSPPAAPTAGETWVPVNGRGYARVISGPREGRFIDLTRGHRHGQAFTIEQRGGKTVHVFSGPDHEEIVDPAHEGVSGRGARSGHRPPKAETWKPVPGAPNYADIVGGKRNGLHVNASGGIRQGMAFQIVNRDGKTFHVYGQGRHELAVEVRSHAVADHRAPAPTHRAPGSTGGMAAPSGA